MTHQETRSKKEQAIQANANFSRDYKKIQSCKHNVHNVHNVTKIKKPKKHDLFSREKANESYPQEDLYLKFTNDFILKVELCSMTKKKITDFALKTMESRRQVNNILKC